MILRCLLALFFSSIIVLSPSCSHAEAQEQPPSASPELSRVPWPQSIQCAHGSFTLDQTARIVAEHLSLLGLANVLAKELRSTCSVELTNTSDAARTGDIPPRLSDNLEDECNIVKINHMASIEGGNYEAVALGTVTLLQLLERNGSVVTSPRLTIEDGRKIAYRGLLVDVARNCHSVDTLRQCVELCRMYKVRYLQLHVSDDQGFTFPSTGYPQLTSMNWHGGPAYTLDELKELEAYASARGIAIVPEFEVPGHAGTMNRSMPEHRRGLSRPHRYGPVSVEAGGRTARAPARDQHRPNGKRLLRGTDHRQPHLLGVPGDDERPGHPPTGADGTPRVGRHLGLAFFA